VNRGNCGGKIAYAEQPDRSFPLPSGDTASRETHPFPSGLSLPSSSLPSSIDFVVLKAPPTAKVILVPVAIIFNGHFQVSKLELQHYSTALSKPIIFRRL
jgi:hypothetical protein